jgi:hypothetical protein
MKANNPFKKYLMKKKMIQTREEKRIMEKKAVG